MVDGKHPDRANWKGVKSGAHKKKIVFVAVGLCVAMLVAAAAFWPEPKEPKYQGKKLSEWLDSDWSNMPQKRQAVLAIGKPGIPFLVKWAWQDRARTKRLAIISKLPAWAQDAWPITVFKGKAKDDS